MGDDNNLPPPPIELSLKLKEVLPEVKSLVSHLTCTICFDPFINPVLTQCKHSFCSVCIRSYLVYNQNCPTCRSQLSDGQLRGNPVADECSSLLRPLLQNIENILATNNISKPQISKDGSQATSKTISSMPQQSNSPVRIKKKIDKDFSDENAQPTQVPKPESSQRHSYKYNSPLRENVRNTSIDGESCTKDDKVAKIVDKEVILLDSPVKQTIKPNHQPTVEKGKIECMVCKVLVPSNNFNLHLDICLNKGSQPPEKPPVKRKPMPKLVYTLIKDADLRKRCKELGLNNKGDRKTLLQRHQKYCILYNSECEMKNPRSKFELLRQIERDEASEVYTLIKDADLRKRCKELGLNNKGDRKTLLQRHQKYCILYNSECEMKNPRSKFELLRQIERDEASERKEARPNPILRFDKNTDISIIEEKKKEYIHNNKSTFQQLIQQAKNQKKSSSSFSQVKSVFEGCSGNDEKKDGRDENDEKKDERNEIIDCEDDNQNVENVAAASNKRKQSSQDASVKKRKVDEKDLEHDEESTQQVESKTDNEKSGKIEPRRSIAESFAISAKKSKPVVKQACPVCSEQVSERYLNIHLDKCLRKNDPDPSPIISKSKQRSKPKVSRPTKKGRKSAKTDDIFASFTTSEESDVDDDFSFPPSPPSPYETFKRRKKIVLSDSEESDHADEYVKGEIILDKTDISDDEIDKEDIFQDEKNEEKVDEGEKGDTTHDEDTFAGSLNSSHIVMEPSLDDLLSMGLGSKSIAESDDNELTNDENDDSLRIDAESPNLIIDDESRIDAGDNDYDQYTECISQESYGQDSDKNENIADDINESIVISDEDESPTIDDTLTNFIDKAADQYFDDNKGEKEKKSDKTVLHNMPSTSKASTSRASVRSTLFQSASDLMKLNRAANQTSKQSPTNVEDKVNNSSARSSISRITRSRKNRSK